MKTVLVLDLAKLRNAEYYQIMLNVMHCFPGELQDKYKFINRYAKLNDCMVLLEGLFNKNKKAKETPEVEAADKARDDMFIGIKQIVQGFLRSGDPAQKAAADKLWHIIEPYKKSHRSNYGANSGSFHKFLVDVKEENVYYCVTALNLNNQIDELTTLNNAFDEIFYKRGEVYQASKESDSLVEIRKNMNVAYRDVIAKVNALYLIADDESVEPAKSEIGALIKQINGILFEMIRTISRRRGIKIIIEDEENKDDENSNGPIELSGELPHE